MDGKLRALQESAEKNRELYNVESPDPTLLEHFETPATTVGSEMWITVEAPEFTCVCPKTGQPDFGSIIVHYRPEKRCLESKSFKLYLMGYRNYGAFHEKVTAQIAADLVWALRPIELKVEGVFKPRGGIAFLPKIHYDSSRVPPVVEPKVLFEKT